MATIRQTEASPLTSRADVLHAVLQQCAPGYGPTDFEPWKACLRHVQAGLPDRQAYEVGHWAEAVGRVWGERGLNAVTLAEGLFALDHPAFPEDDVIRAAEEQAPDDLVITLRLRSQRILRDLPHDGWHAVDLYVTLHSDQPGTSSGENTNHLDNEGLTPGQHVVWIGEPDPGDQVDIVDFVHQPGMIQDLIHMPQKVSPRIWQTTVLDEPVRGARHWYNFVFHLAGSEATYRFDPWLGTTRAPAASA